LSCFRFSVDYKAHIPFGKNSLVGFSWSPGRWLPAHHTTGLPEQASIGGLQDCKHPFFLKKKEPEQF